MNETNRYDQRQIAHADIFGFYIGIIEDGRHMLGTSFGLTVILEKIQEHVMKGSSLSTLKRMQQFIEVCW